MQRHWRSAWSRSRIRLCGHTPPGRSAPWVLQKRSRHSDRDLAWSRMVRCLTSWRSPSRLEGRRARAERKAAGPRTATFVAPLQHHTGDCCITTPVGDDARSPLLRCALPLARGARELARHLLNPIRNAKAGWSSCFEYPTHTPSAGMSWFSSRATTKRATRNRHLPNRELP